MLIQNGYSEIADLSPVIETPLTGVLLMEIQLTYYPCYASDLTLLVFALGLAVCEMVYVSTRLPLTFPVVHDSPEHSEP